MSRLEGTVVKIVGTQSYVDTPEGLLRCSLRARLFRRLGVRLAVGDRVALDLLDIPTHVAEEGGEEVPREGMIEAVLPRRSALRRERDFKRDQVLVANVDRIFIVVAVMDPPYNRRFIDRLIVAVERDELEPVIVFNKLDLADADYLDVVGEDAGIYARLGYPCLLVSAAGGQGLDELHEAFQGRISAVVGPSGVGKSTLLNAVCPGLSLRTGEVSEADGRGRHTTSAAELVRLPRGEGFVVDTPGLRGFGLWGLGPRDVVQGFREIEEAAAACRFRDCAHRSEPDCAVQAAVAEGGLDGERFESYLRLVDELEASATVRQASRRR